jgi:uncharacterized Zn finger protein
MIITSYVGKGETTMQELIRTYIRKEVSDSDIIYTRGVNLFEHGAFLRTAEDPERGSFAYRVDGSFGDYNINIRLLKKGVKTFCDCPFPGNGCKHIVAALLDVDNLLTEYHRKEATATTESLQER